MSNKYYDEAQVQDIIADISNKCRMPVLGAGGGFAPIGARGYFEGQTAPQGWLICDGSTKNIADYPDLAAYIASQQGSVNYYGGNGTTTFGLPTMNGMPSGGVDTPNEHIIGERRETVDGVLKSKPVYEKVVDFGALPSNTTKSVQHNIDDVEDFVRIQCMIRNNSGYSLELIVSTSNLNNQTVVSADKTYCSISTKATSFTIYSAKFTLSYTKTSDTWQPVQEGHSADGNGMFCIKATLSDAELNAFNVYTPREHQVAWWEEEIDGVWKRKPVYERMVTESSITLSDRDFVTAFSQSQYDIDKAISVVGFTTDKTFPLCVKIKNGNVQLFMQGMGDYIVNTLVIEYTKTTDEWQTS